MPSQVLFRSRNPRMIVVAIRKNRKPRSSLKLFCRPEISIPSGSITNGAETNLNPSGNLLTRFECSSSKMRSIGDVKGSFLPKNWICDQTCQRIVTRCLSDSFLIDILVGDPPVSCVNNV